MRTGTSNILHWSLRVGKIFGIPIRLHWSFLLAVVALVYFGSRPAAVSGDGWGEAVMWAMIRVAAFFGLVLAHEFGHTFAFMSQGIRPRGIMLLALGGETRPSEAMPGPKTDLFVTAAGPVVNLFLLVPTFLLMLLLNHRVGDLSAGILGGRQALPFLFYTNMFLAAFNLLPAYPLDGGRMLASALSLRLKPRTGYRLAAKVGYPFGAMMFLGGLYLSQSICGWILLSIGISVVLQCYRLEKLLDAGAPMYSSSVRAGTVDGDLEGGFPDDVPWAGAGEGEAEPGYSDRAGEIRRRRELEREREEERAMRARVDEILDKVRRGGTESLNTEEKDFMRQASRRFRQKRM